MHLLKSCEHGKCVPGTLNVHWQNPVNKHIIFMSETIN